MLQRMTIISLLAFALFAGIGCQSGQTIADIAFETRLTVEDLQDELRLDGEDELADRFDDFTPILVAIETGEYSQTSEQIMLAWAILRPAIPDRYRVPAGLATRLLRRLVARLEREQALEQLQTETEWPQ